MTTTMNSSPPMPAAGHITCKASVQLVSLLRDGELSPQDQARLHAHVNDCPRCQVASQQFARLHDALDQLFERPGD